MSLHKIKQLKKDKGFRPWDIAVYATLTVLIVALILFFAFGRDKSPPKGFEIYYQNDLIFTYDYKDATYQILKDNITVESEDSSTLNLRFCARTDTPQKDYNLIVVDKKNNSVKVTAADCSTRMDCVYMAPITQNSHFIACTPHALKILPYGYQPSDNFIPIG